MSEKQPAFPRRALIVKTPYLGAGSYANAVSIEACDVLALGDDGFATVEIRVGGKIERRHVNIADLASTPDRAAAKVAAHFAALLSRPLLSPVAGMTESMAAATSER